MELLSAFPDASPRYALFDFDGTVSLLREGWQSVMYRYFAEVLALCPGAEGVPQDEIRKNVMAFVDRLTGKQTIFQCLFLAGEVERLGGEPLDPLEYKAEYLRRLMERIQDRHAALRSGEDPTGYLVPGVVDFLRFLQENGVQSFLASGTDEEDVVAEAELLGVDTFFEGIFGANDANCTECSKEIVIRELIASHNLSGEGFVSFGDGYVEIELTKAVAGYAVAVASDEAARSGFPDPWKRTRLIEAGADCVIADFRDTAEIRDWVSR